MCFTYVGVLTESFAGRERCWHVKNIHNAVETEIKEWKDAIPDQTGRLYQVNSSKTLQWARKKMRKEVNTTDKERKQWNKRWRAYLKQKSEHTRAHTNKDIQIHTHIYIHTMKFSSF